MRVIFEPGSPWEKGDNEIFKGKLRNAMLNGEIFYTLADPRILTERWGWHYNTVRPHSSPGYRLPAPVTILPPMAKSTYPKTARALS